MLAVVVGSADIQGAGGGVGGGVVDVGHRVVVGLIDDFVNLLAVGLGVGIG